MKLKRFLSVVLILCMILPLVPVVVFADGNEAKIGDTEYETLAKALAAAPASGGTITLLRDITVADTLNRWKWSGTIDGAGHKITMNSGKVFQMDGCDYTIKNAIVESPSNIFFLRPCGQSHIDSKYGSSVTIENCTVTSNGAIVYSNADNGAESANRVIVRDSTLESKSEGIFKTNQAGGATYDISIENSNVILSGKAEGLITGWNAKQTFNITTVGSTNIFVKSANVENVLLKKGWDKTSAKLQLGTNTKVYFDPQVADNDTSVSMVVSGANSYTSLEINDLGATYYYSKSALTHGANYPVVTLKGTEKSFKLNNERLVKIPDGYGLTSTLLIVGETAEGDYLSVTLSSEETDQTAKTTTDEDQIAIGMVCRIGAEGTGSYYATLSSAVAAVCDGDVVTLIGDIGGAATTENYEGWIENKNFTIDGAGHTLESNRPNVVMPKNTTLTIKSLTLKTPEGCALLVHAEGACATLNLEDCRVEGKMALKVWGGRTSADVATINLTNTTLVAGADDGMLFSNNGTVTNFKLTMDNSSFKSTQGGGAANHSLFKFAGSNRSEAEISLTNGSSLIGAKTNAAGNVVFNGDAGAWKLTLNLDDTSKIELDGTASVTSKYFEGSFVSFTLNDTGADWVLDSNAVETSSDTAFPANSGLIGWVVENKLIKPGALNKNDYTSYEDGLVMKTLTEADLGLTRVAGAAIRTADEQGIRFQTTMSKKAYDLLKSIEGLTIEFGTYICYGKQETIDRASVLQMVVDGDAIKVVGTAVENGDVYTFNACLYGMNCKDQYEQQFSVMSYFKVNYSNWAAEDYTVYTEYNADNDCRSLYDVAQKCTDAEKETTFVKEILEQCAPAT